MAKYSDFRQRLKAELLKAKRSGNPISTEMIKAALGVSAGAVSAWRSGTRLPASKHLDTLAGLFHPNDVVAAATLAKEFRALHASGERGPDFGFATRGVRIAGSEERSAGFLRDFSARFFQIAGVKQERVNVHKLGLSLKDVLAEGNADIGLGMFATIDRALTIRFFNTPIRIGLNAVVLDRHLKANNLKPVQLRSALMFEPKRIPGLRIVPLIVEPDVGGIYITRMLSISTNIESLPNAADADSYASRLIAFREPNAVPVAVVDEISALEILEKLTARGETGRLVFSLNNEHSVKSEKRDLPEFLLSLSVRRAATHLINYFNDALRLFLLTETQTIASYYVDSRVDLEALAFKNYPSESREVRKREAALWTEYAFRLHKKYQDFDLPSWKPILNRALELSSVSRKR